nr:MAG TPA: hypothetical protein [Caudoviricetes sp.]
MKQLQRFPRRSRQMKLLWKIVVLTLLLKLQMQRLKCLKQSFYAMKAVFREAMQMMLSLLQKAMAVMLCPLSARSLQSTLSSAPPVHQSLRKRKSSPPAFIFLRNRKAPAAELKPLSEDQIQTSDFRR